MEQRLAGPLTGPKQQTSQQRDSDPKVEDPQALQPRPKAANRLIKGLAACKQTHLKALVLNNSYLAPTHRALQGLLAL